MMGLVRKLRPVSGSALKSYGCPQTGLAQGLLQLGSLAPGVVGLRFGSQDFSSFMARMLHFQPKERATAGGLLEHAWFHNRETLALGSSGAGQQRG